MAAVSITVGNVARISGTVVSQYLSAVTVTAGQIVYLDANNQWRLAQCDGTPIESGFGSNAIGVALHASLAGQPLAVQTTGTITIGGTVAAGVIYIPGQTAGAINPVADISSTNYLTILAFATSATVLQLVNNPTGVVAA